MARILIDGYNLGLEKGTGVATYARNLSYEIAGLGHEVDVLYGNRMSVTRNALLNEVYFFDSTEDERIKLLEIIEQFDAFILG